MAKIKQHREMFLKERITLFFGSLIIFPLLSWFFTFQVLYGIPEDIDKKLRLKYIWYVFDQTFQFKSLYLLLAFVLPILFIFLVGFRTKVFRPNVYTGQAYKKFLRGTQLVTPEFLYELVKDKSDKDNIQLEIANMPIPIDKEGVHFLENGSTGTGKSVGFKEINHHIRMRQKSYREYNERYPNKKQKIPDRCVTIDPNGDLFSIFGNLKRDKLLNPYDIRTVGWSVFNEIRNDYDYHRLALSIVPTSAGASDEKWNGYARQLLISVMKYVKNVALENNKKPSMKDVFYIATVLEVNKLKPLMQGYEAEAMFVEGADKALGSARFTLSDRLPSILLMPEGDFSIRDFLQDGNEGDIYITWREDQKSSLKPLITMFADIIITTILSLPKTKVGCYGRSIPFFLDEIASMDVISSLTDGLEKGRKHGLKIFAGCQTIKQLIAIYGETEAYVLLSNFKNLMVLGGAKTDPETAEFMSKALGEMDVLRNNENSTSGSNNSSKSTSVVKYTERVVMPSELASLPELYLFIAFAGNMPVTRTKFNIINFKEINEPILERTVSHQQVEQELFND
ncbi:type IV secretion system DNA-binding domain-containing protein [Acinetobacter pittii]|uniref:type IV secretion system DNA-binding domain-containing protein n=1 Tax=Acinetobacter pittii TaxID=48296 RepID=UPI0032605CD3